MKFVKTAVIAACVLLCTIVQISAADRIAVMPFAVGDGINPIICTAIYGTFLSELNKTDKYDVVDTSEVYETMKSLSVNDVQNIDVSSAISIGNALSSDFVFCGKIAFSDSKTRMKILIESINVSSGNIITKTADFIESDDNVSFVCSVIITQIISGDNDPNVYKKELSDKQLLHLALLNSQGIDINNGKEMKKKFKFYLGLGIAGAVLDSVLITAAGGFMGGLFGASLGAGLGSFGYLLGGIIGGALIGVDWIIAPILCVIGFVRMGRTYAVYRNTTGRKKFDSAPQLSFGGGYDWERQEVALSMSVRL